MIEETFKKFLEFILTAIDFEIYIVETDEELSETVNFFTQTIDTSDQSLDLDDKKDEIIEWVCGFDRIIWCTLWLNHKDYNKIISELHGREFIKNEEFITNVLTSDNSQMMMLQFKRVKTKNSRKTIEEFQNELDEAVSSENFEEASRLKKKINVMLDKELQNKQKIKQALKNKVLKK